MKNILIVLLVLISFQSFSASQEKVSQKSLDNAFQQLFKSDGHAAEELDIKIGKTIKTHPLLFLKALKKYEKKISRLDAILGNFGEEFVDQAEKSKKEGDERIKSLENAKKKLTDKNLIRLADRCLKLLKERQY